MKNVLVTMGVALAMFAMQPVMADQAKPAKKDATTQQQAAPNPAEFDKQLAQMQKNMQTMHNQMAKISQAQDPQERQKLMQEHWNTMRGSMDMMQGMWSAGGMGCCMMGGNMMGSGKGCCADGGMMGGEMNGGHMMGGNMMGGNMMGDGHMMGWEGMHGYYNKLTPEQQKQRQYMSDQYMQMQQMMMDNMMQHQYWMNAPAPASK